MFLVGLSRAHTANTATRDRYRARCEVRQILRAVGGWRNSPRRCDATSSLLQFGGAVNVIEMGDNLKNQIAPQNIFEPRNDDAAA